VAIAVIGPFLAPHDPAAIVGFPFLPPSGAYPLGTDRLGRDVLSRVLAGGHSLLALAAVTTAVAYTIGSLIGLYGGYTRSRVDAVVMRIMDAMIAFPVILMLLVLAAALGPGTTVVFVGLSISYIPYVARLVRAATLEVSVRGYVEAAIARGERTSSILAREILPGIRKELTAAIVPGFSGVILGVAALNFLGVGVSFTTPDWAAMINENRVGIIDQPWALVVPSVLIAMICIGVNLLADYGSRRERIERLPR
jgi:peptide/nickel transport system permease protein